MNPALQAKNIAASPLWAEPLRQWPRIKRWSLHLAEFSFIQVLVQLFAASAGLLIVRTMSKHDYALYAIANSMQVTGNLLADLGIGIGVGSIGGRVWNNPQRFSQLINTAVSLRRRFALISLGCTLPLSAWMLLHNDGNWVLTLGLCVTIVAGVVPLLGLSVFNATLRLQSQYRRIQKLDLGNAGLRLGLTAALALTRMNALLAALIGVVGNWVQLIFGRRWAREYADPAAQTSPDDRCELMKLSWRWMPNVIFFCFQGQISLLILTLMGTPTGVADITALGRIAMFLAILSVTFSNVLAPRFARCQERSQLPRLYVLLVGGTALVLLPILVLAWLLPGPFLWLLGEKYANLERECALVVATGCVSQIGSVMANLNISKAWIRIQSIGAIPTLLTAQAVAALCLDLRQFHHVLIFNLVTTASPIWLFALDAYFGVRRDIGSEPARKKVLVGSVRSRMIFKTKLVVRAALKRHGRHILYIPPIEPTGFDLAHDLGIVVDAPTPLIFDVGANVGQSVELFRRAFPQARTFAFEPDPDCFAELVRKYRGPNIQFFQVALSSTEGSEELYRYERSVLNSLLPLDPSPDNCFGTVKIVGKENIATRKIDSLMNELGITHLDLLKVDTQGWDYHVLLGAAEAFGEARIKSVLVELNFDPMYQGQAPAEAIISYLSQHGFGLVDFYEKVRRNNRLSWCTALFVK